MKVALTIAGSDSSGGAGIQADLKTFESFGVFGTSAVTVLTAQNTTGVQGIYPVSAEFIKKQIDSVMSDFDVSVVKLGMLFNKEIINIVKDFIKDLKIPVVLDPVFISKANAKLLEDDAIAALEELFEYATIITPNQYEAHALFGYEFGDSESLKKVFACPTKVVIKTQKMEMGDSFKSVDMMFDGRDKKTFISDYVDTDALHGTGCSYSSAIAANLALGKSLEESVMIAKEFIFNAIKNAPNLGEGKGPINHKKGGELCQVN